MCHAGWRVGWGCVPGMIGVPDRVACGMGVSAWSVCYSLALMSAALFNSLFLSPDVASCTLGPCPVGMFMAVTLLVALTFCYSHAFLFATSGTDVDTVNPVVATGHGSYFFYSFSILVSFVGSVLSLCRICAALCCYCLFHSWSV